MAGSSRRTVRDFLTRPNPKVEIPNPSKRRSKSTGTTKNPQYPIPRDVRHFEWFDADLVHTILDKKLANVLNESADGLKSWLPSLDNPRQIFQENSLRDVATAYIIPPVRDVLQHEHSKHVLDQSIDISSGSDAIMYFLEGTRFESDWAGTSDIQPRSQCSENKPYTILPGEAKPSWTCNSTVIQELTAQEEEEEEEEEDGKFLTLWPFRQLLHYCVGAFSRYGYILTDKELLVIRVRPSCLSRTAIEDQRRCSEWFQDNAIMDYFSVPWDTHGSTDGLTICLALWVLHMLAANNGHLSTTPYASLCDEKIVGREHQILLGSKPDSIESARNTEMSQSLPGAVGTSFESIGTAQESEEDDRIYRSFARPHVNASFGSQISNLSSKRKRFAEEYVEETWVVRRTSDGSPAPTSPPAHSTRSRKGSNPPQSSSRPSNAAYGRGKSWRKSKRPRR